MAAKNLIAGQKTTRTLGAALAVVAIFLGLVSVFTPGAWGASTVKTIYKFKGGDGDGATPYAGMVFDKDGNLYGTTAGGGPQNAGTVFKLTPNTDGSWMKSVLYIFCALQQGCPDGAGPVASLIFDADGNLYGTTAGGGYDLSAGVVFKLAPNLDGSWTESVLHGFGLLGDGRRPLGGLVFDPAGNLYGTTQNGGAKKSAGMVFKLAPNLDGTWTESVLYNFCLPTCHSGALSQAGLVFDKAGNLYGTAVEGGSHSLGVVFMLIPNKDGSWTEKVVHSFCSQPNCRDGGIPGAGVTFDQAGNLYGTTTFGGAHNRGTVFELTSHPGGTWTTTVLHNFCPLYECDDGSNALADVVFDQAGNLYGTTRDGGNLNFCKGTFDGCGVVFKLTPTSKGGWKESVLYRFLDHPGAFPLAGVILDAAGKLYGTTSNEGTSTYGTVFEITP